MVSKLKLNDTMLLQHIIEQNVGLTWCIVYGLSKAHENKELGYHYESMRLSSNNKTANMYLIKDCIKVFKMTAVCYC